MNKESVRMVRLSFFTVMLICAISTAAGPLPLLDWQIEEVNTSSYGYQGPSLALDIQDNPYISSGSSGWGLQFSWRDASGWHTELIEPGGGSGAGYTDTSLAWGGYSGPHISYHDYTHDVLKYAHLSGTIWVTTTIDSGGSSSSIALDQTAKPRIAYFGPTYDVRYAYFDGTSWYTETVDPGRGWPGCASLVLDSLNRPHILYQTDMLKHAYFASGWQIEVVDSWGGDCGEMELDSSDQPRISYGGFCEGGGTGPTGLCYGYKDGTGWHIEIVDDEGDVGWHSSLELDEANLPHISYYKFDDKDLRYAYLSGTVWITDTVDTLNAGLVSSLVLDSSNEAHIAYEGAFQLKYAFAGVPGPVFRVFLPLVARNCSP